MSIRMKPEITKRGTVTIDGDGEILAEHFTIDCHQYSNRDGPVITAQSIILKSTIEILEKELKKYE